MIRKLTSGDNAAVMAFLLPESAFNLFIIGDIENVGYDSNIQDIWAEFGEQQVIRAVLLRYFSFYIFYASGECDLAGFAAIVNSDPNFEVISGKQEALMPLAALLRVNRSKQFYFARLDDAAQLDSAADYSMVHKATIDDVDEIIGVRSRIEEFHRSPSARESLRNGMENGSSHTYFYRVDGQMVANASTTAENSQSAMIVGVCSLPEHRRKGYATLCMNALCREVLERGKFLCLFYDNPEAGKIYKRIGFRDIGMYAMYYAAPPSSPVSGEPE